MAWDVMSGVTKMAWDVMSGVTKTAWDVLSGVANLCGMFCPGCKKMAWDVLSWDVLSGSPLINKNLSLFRIIMCLVFQKSRLIETLLLITHVGTTYVLF